MARSLPIALVAGLAACSSEQTAARPGPAGESRPSIVEPEPARGFAVVPPGTALRIAPREHADTLTLEPNEAVAFRVIKEVGSFIELETLPPSDADEHCAVGRLEAPRALRLRFFARREQLAAVLPTTTTVAWNGTRALFRAGSWVRPGQPKAAVDAAGLSVSLPIDPDMTGRFYQVGAPLPGKGTARVPEHGLTLPDGTPLPSTGIDGADGADGAVVTFGHAERDGEYVVDVGNRCARLAIPSAHAPVAAYAFKGSKGPHPELARGGEPSDEKPEGFVQADPTRPDARFYTVVAGTTVEWTGGRVAGRAAQAASLYGVAQEDGSRTCLSLSTDEGRESFQLCFASGDIW